MQKQILPMRLGVVIALAACVVSSFSCMTTYDAYGRPVQSVDPAVAVAGAVAAGAVGYAVANNHNNNDNYYYRHAPPPPPRYPHGGGRYYYRRGYR